MNSFYGTMWSNIVIERETEVEESLPEGWHDLSDLVSRETLEAEQAEKAEILRRRLKSLNRGK